MFEYIVDENQHKSYFFLIDTIDPFQDTHLRFYVKRNAVVVVEILIAHVSAQVVIDCILQEEGADARITGVYMINASDKVTVTTTQHHVAPHTRSMLTMKGILQDNADAHYQGIIRVEKEASDTYASQENKNILLSSNARAVSVPSLEVLTHEVRCFHASAIGKFDREQLLYAASRGIDEKTIQQLLLQAFIEGLFTDTCLKQRLSNLIEL